MLTGCLEGTRTEMGDLFHKILFNIFEHFCLAHITNFDFFLNLQSNTRFLNNPLSPACDFSNKPRMLPA